MKNVCVIGMGFVGLTFSAVLAEKGFTVYGIEKNPAILEALQRKQAHFFEKGLSEKLGQFTGKSLFFSKDIPAQKMDVYVITVGTPVEPSSNKPLLFQIEESARMIADHFTSGALVVLRSTVLVGTTRDTVLPILSKTKKPFYLAFCPERTIEGNALAELTELPQIIGALDSKSEAKAGEFFSAITGENIFVSSLESAELVKLINNTWRDATFALANEISHFCEKAGLDAFQVISAANHHYKRSSIPVPGFAISKIPVGGFVGGFCLRKDPHLLIASGERNGIRLGLFEHARSVNYDLPKRVAERIHSLVPDRTQKILLCGFGFKGEPETDDTRDSPTLDVVSELRRLGHENLVGHDFLVKPEKIKSFSVSPVSLKDGFENAGAVIFCTNSKRYAALDISPLVATLAPKAVFFDSWRLFDPKNPVFSRVKYASIGLGAPNE